MSMELSDLYIGDKVEINIPTQCIGEPDPIDYWYKAEVVQQVSNDELGEYVGLLVFPTILWGEEPMKVRSTDNLRCHFKNLV